MADMFSESKSRELRLKQQRADLQKRNASVNLSTAGVTTTTTTRTALASTPASDTPITTSISSATTTTSLRKSLLNPLKRRFENNVTFSPTKRRDTIVERRDLFDDLEWNL
ncbi:hypothetical protein BGZ79_001492 [Entomortierella chlamydospora]|nr:hypothetical protein BGZ79_001492 [Entomortierella chlamydospora]